MRWCSSCTSCARGDLFIDVGANVGSFSILAAGVRGAHVVAIEPVHATLLHLADNIRLNHRHLSLGSPCRKARLRGGCRSTRRIGASWSQFAERLVCAPASRAFNEPDDV
jgi:hypothetical protein